MGFSLSGALGGVVDALSSPSGALKTIGTGGMYGAYQGFQGGMGGSGLFGLGDNKATGFNMPIGTGTASGANEGKNLEGLSMLGGGVNRYGEARPDQIMTRDLSTGELAPQFKASMGTANQKLLDKAMSEGDSPWAQMQRQAIGQRQALGTDQLAQQQAGQLARAQNQMAMRGGLRGGANERLQSSAVGAGMMGRQGLGREAALSNLNVSMQDESSKNQMLGQMGNVQQKLQDTNQDRLRQDVLNQNRFNMGLYGQDMSALGAQMTAQAQSQAAQPQNGIGNLWGLL